MSLNYKTLGQSLPAANTLTDLYTVPALKEAVISTLSICNQGRAATFSLALRVNGEALSNKNYLIYNYSLDPNDVLFLTLGLTLGAGDILSIIDNTGNVSFTLSGCEII